MFHQFQPLPQVNFPVVLAPMVGLSHIGLRYLVRFYTPRNARTFWPTEMLNSRRLPLEKMGFTEETLKDCAEDLLVPQLLGNEQTAITESIRRLEDWGAQAIDINMGCPVAKALRHNYGVALMGNSDYAAEVVAMAVRSTKKPISVKLRAGIDSNRQTLLEFILKLESAGASWVTLHPRLAHQKRRGVADWDVIRFIKSEVKIPVIGNGDVQTKEDVFSMLSTTGCQGVMVGRALTARPWLMWQVGEALGFETPSGCSGVAPQTPYEEGAEYGRSLLILLHFLSTVYPPLKLKKKFMYHVKTSHWWLQFGHTLFSELSGADDVPKLERIIRKFFSQPQAMNQKTSLRE